ncbi:MAG: PQQ-binding-like beta-propeller repeat protein [Armatimonadota bacterium]
MNPAPPSSRNWPDFRGPAGDGHGVARGLPRTWAPNRNVVWRTPIHDSGWSSPIVAGDRVWITTATESGTTQWVVCVDARTGKVLLDDRVFENERPERIGAQGNTYASPSSVTDGRHVVSHFGTYGTVCHDVRSLRRVWTRRDLQCLHFQGPGSSPLLWRGRVVLTYDGADVQFVTALDLRTGKTLWRTDRGTDWSADAYGGKDDPDQRKAFSTPFLTERDGRPELVTAAARCFVAYDPATGRETWRLPHPGFSNATRPVAGGGMIYLDTGFNRPEMLGVRLPKGRVPGSADIAWRVSRSVPTMSSPLLHEGLLTYAADSDFLSCIDAASGAEVWRERIGGRQYASPLLADGAIHWVSDNGRTLITEPGRTFRVLGEGRLDEGSRSSPAVFDNSLLIRTYDALYRIGAT